MDVVDDGEVKETTFLKKKLLNQNFIKILSVIVLHKSNDCFKLTSKLGCQILWQEVLQH